MKPGNLAYGVQCRPTSPKNSVPNSSSSHSTSQNTSTRVYYTTASGTDEAREIREVIATYDPSYMAASLDEAYMNITQYVKEHDISPEEAVTQLRADILEKTKITTSAGLGASTPTCRSPNIDTLLAKLGSNKNKALPSSVLG
jgi:nucleotidyltransferase/DNA polymerase involved in DNA repair